MITIELKVQQSLLQQNNLAYYTKQVVMITVIGTPNPNNCDLLDNPAFLRFVDCLASILQKYGHIVLDSLDTYEDA